MALDASIYGLARPVQMPDYLDSAQKAAQIGNAQLGQAHLMQQMRQSDVEAKRLAHLQKASDFGNALSSLSGLSEQERAAAYPKVRSDLLSQGVATPDQMPEQYDPGFYGATLKRFMQTKEGIEQQLKQAQVSETRAQASHYGAQNRYMLAQERHLNAENAKLLADAKSAKHEFSNLPMENQEQIKDLSKAVAGKTDIKNHIDSALEILNSPKVPEDQKIVAGENLLKTLNSAEGKDAVGAEEARRLGSFLEFKIMNFRNPGSFIGRDLDKFTEQVRLKSGELGQAAERNRSRIDELYGRSARSVAPINVGTDPASKKLAASGGLMPDANAAAGVQAPKLGSEDGGYVYMGGDPADKKSWKRAR